MFDIKKVHEGGSVGKVIDAPENYRERLDNICHLYA